MLFVLSIALNSRLPVPQRRATILLRRDSAEQLATSKSANVRDRLRKYVRKRSAAAVVERRATICSAKTIEKDPVAAQ